jgi:hypothetical protein
MEVCLWFRWLAEIIFKLEEEGSVALLLHLPEFLLETAVFGLASGLGCRIVVAIVQAPAENQNDEHLLLCRYLPIPYKKRRKLDLPLSE